MQVRELGEVIDALEEAQASGKRISEIVRDMATFANPNPKRTRVRLTDIVQGAMRWLPSSMNLSARIQVEDLGAPEIMAASGQLEQVVHNLLTNAARASSETLGKILVRIGPGSPGMARLEVVDHGVGIPEETVDRIFEPFYTTRPVGEGRGAGLGLAISRAIIVSHGGTITVESEVGKGSKFTVDLPAATAGA
jgi:signal transduction histidine kinase